MIRNIIILILILAFIGIAVFLDIPKVQEVLSLRKEIQNQEEIFLEKQILLAKVEKLQKTYEENKESLEKTDYILPSDQDIPNLIVQLESLALEAGLILEEIEFLTEEEGFEDKARRARKTEEGTVAKDYQTINVTLNLIGSYSSFRELLRLIEENMRLMDVSFINFSVENTELGSFFEFSLRLMTYYQK